MIAALEYLGRITDVLFEAHMQRAAQRISANTQLLTHR
jgi:hypothetical protein